QGGCWAVPGGALNHGEEPLEGALREFAEEVGAVLSARDFSVVDVYQDDHGGWSYWTVIIEVPERFAAPAALNWETAETGWISHDELGDLELHPAFRRTLGRLGLLHDSHP
ncbi:MAG TPA: NUDIX domain-containing protein, partial [Acidimicrobiia bacterium]|nr:NUDIX domain-containing protein [Acidimicrobiia bacterium]